MQTTSLDEQAGRGSGGASKTPLARYLFAIAAAVGAVVISAAILELGWSGETPVYAPLIGAVALATWYGGLGPAAVTIVLGWFGALLLLTDSRGDLIFGGTDDTTRWWINLAVGIVVAAVGGLLRLRERQRAGEAQSAHETIRDVEALQELTIALSSAAFPADVSRAVSFHALGVLSADGVAFGLLDGEDVAIVDAVGLAAPRSDVRLGRGDEALLAAATRDGASHRAPDRRTLEADYPESARVLRDVRSAVAIPLRTSGEVVGAVLFVFGDEGRLDDDTMGLARIVGDLAAQALERARLYERERESRRALERILLVAPRFLADDSGDLSPIICREARTTFGADYGVLWRIRGGLIDLLAVDPPRPELAGTTLPLDDFPRLHDAIQSLGTSFVADVLETTHGVGNDFVRKLGIRSSLRTPMVVSGSSELLLSISWETVISEPDPATIAVVRRFVDQAGLALEQVERRRAQDEVLARAEAARRLHEVTAALSQAASTLDVSTTCLRHALETIGAEAGFVVLKSGDGVEVELVTSHGYDEDELAAWRSLASDADVPFARALETGDPVWALAQDEVRAFTGITEARAHGWVSLPLKVRRGTAGALHLSLRRPRQLTEAEKEWLQSMVSQCGQALERSELFEEEQRSRMRAERLQGITTQLSNALTPADVADVVVEQVEAAVGPSGVAVVAVREGTVGATLAGRGDPEITAAVLDREREDGSREARALQRRGSVVIDGHGHTALLVPLVAGRRLNGLLVAAWSGGHRLSAEDQAIVEALAGQAALALDRAEQFESEQVIAETLQRSVLPVSLPRVDGVTMAARYLPGSVRLDVGGDWFDALRLPDGKLGLVVGDVVGKGVQAAASMAQLRNAIRAFSVERLKPSSMLGRLDRLANDVLETSFATVVYLVLDPETGACRLSSAGHPPALLVHPDGRVEFLEQARGLPLGTGVGARYRQESVELAAGSVVLLYTDGLVERRGRSIDDGLDDLRRAVLDAPRDPDRLLDHVLERVVGDAERTDDIAVLAARVLPVAPRSLELRLRADLASMDMVRDALRTWLGGTRLDRREAEDVVLATWEACANAIEHAVEPATDIVVVHADIQDGDVRIVVRDTGTWAPASGREDRGLGLPLIESLVTSVEIARGGNGTTVTLVKAVPEPHAAG